MMINLGLEDVHTEKIGYIDENHRNYSSIINVTDFELTVYTNGGPSYPYANPIPKEEMFVIACKNNSDDPNQWTQSYSLSNAHIIPNNMTHLWPFAGTFNDYHFNVSDYEFLSSYQSIFVGNVTYLAPGDQVPSPDEQCGHVYMLDDVAGSQQKLDNITNAEGAIIIDSETKGIQCVNASQCSFSVASMNNSSDVTVKELLENFTVLVDNVGNDGENLTFTYNLSEGWWPDSQHVYIDRIPDHYELWNDTGLALLIATFLSGYDKPNIGAYLGCVQAKSIFWRLLNEIRPDKCVGVVLYDSYDYHYMLSIPFKALPVFTLNNSVGTFLRNNHDTTTLSGYANQEYLAETENSSGAIGYNVVGNITIDKSPNDAVVI